MKSHIAPAVALLLGIAGCQMYEPLPLDLDAHAQAWQARDIASDEVQSYAAELARLNPDRTAPFDATDGLHLHEAELVALVFNPQLRVARLNARVERISAEHADLWDDPTLDF